MTSAAKFPQAGEIVREGDAGAAQPVTEAANLRHAPFDHAALAQQRYLTLEEAAAYLRFPSAAAFWAWAKRQGLRPHKAGRLNLYRRELLEQWVEQGPQPGHAQQPARRRRRNASQSAWAGVR
jgi:hypothetical protein